MNAGLRRSDLQAGRTTDAKDMAVRLGKSYTAYESSAIRVSQCHAERSARAPLGMTLGNPDR
ncbi:MAG TPA: hypothetical protein VFZ21_23065, partial [Gemmatimonadaceae bacterium]|nr:hypothetical protein [Gemmatimonadaceae bacterium]